MARLRTGDKHKEILEAALTLFMREGVVHTGIRDIATEAKVALGTVYLSYADKHDVIAACAGLFEVEHFLEATQLELKTSAKSETRKYLLSRYRNWKRVSDGSPQAAELAQAILRLRPEKILEFEALFVQTLSRLIQNGIEQRH